MKPTIACLSSAVAVAVALCSSTVLAREQHQDAFTIFGDKDAPGSDYKELDGVSLDKCESGCQQDIQCKAFTYNGPKRVCFLKKAGEFQLMDHQGATTGAKHGSIPIETRFSIFRDKDSPGSDYKEIDETSLGRCQSKCSEGDECKVFSYNVARHVCFLKSQLASRLIRFPGAITGTKLAADTGGVSEPSTEKLVPLASVNYDGKQTAKLGYGDLVVTVDSEPSPDGNGRVPVATGKYADKAAFVLRVDENGRDEPSVDVSVMRLDSTTPMPQIVLMYFWMGAHRHDDSRLLVTDATNFPPTVARYLYRRFTDDIKDQDKIIIYDPSAGFGGRLLGALSAGTDRRLHYLGTDPNPDNWPEAIGTL